MPRRRIVVSATQDDDLVSRLGRVLRDAGHEVVHVGVGLEPEQLRRTLVAEDPHGLVWAGADDVPDGVDVAVVRADGLTPDELVDAVDALSDERR